MADERAQSHQHPRGNLRVRPARLLRLATPRCRVAPCRPYSVGVDDDAAGAGIAGVAAAVARLGRAAEGRRHGGPIPAEPGSGEALPAAEATPGSGAAIDTGDQWPSPDGVGPHDARRSRWATAAKPRRRVVRTRAVCLR